jgi:hypothetical protein
VKFLRREAAAYVETAEVLADNDFSFTGDPQVYAHRRSAALCDAIARRILSGDLDTPLQVKP